MIIPKSLLFTILALAFFTILGCKGKETKPLTQTVKEGEFTKCVLKVDGMTCGGCVDRVKTMLKENKGIKSTEVSLEPGQAVVKFDPALISKEKIIASINQLGFAASKKSEEN